MREHTDGDFPFANDFNAVVQALADDALVVSGCEVSDGDTNDMSLDVASGSVRINGSEANVSTQSVTLANSDPSYDRYDLIVVDSTGSATNVTGDATAMPKAPSIPADAALLAIVRVPASTSGVTDSEISGARVVYAVAQSFVDHENAGNPHSNSASQANLTNHANDSSAHHAPPTTGEKALWYAGL